MKGNSEVNKFKGYLRSKGLKFTFERRIILETIFSLHNHFDVEDLYRKIEKRIGERISLATIYRTLPLLVESGLIREALKCQERGVYEHIWGHKHHDHIICINCGKVIEFTDEDIEKLQEKVCKKFNFKPMEHRLGIRGYCGECQKKIS